MKGKKKNKKNHIAKCKHRLRTSGVPYCYNSDGHIVGTLWSKYYYSHILDVETGFRAQKEFTVAAELGHEPSILILCSNQHNFGQR